MATILKNANVGAVAGTRWTSDRNIYVVTEFGSFNLPPAVAGALSDEKTAAQLLAKLRKEFAALDDDGVQSRQIAEAQAKREKREAAKAAKDDSEVHSAAVKRNSLLGS